MCKSGFTLSFLAMLPQQQQVASQTQSNVKVISPKKEGEDEEEEEEELEEDKAPGKYQVNRDSTTKKSVEPIIL